MIVSVLDENDFQLSTDRLVFSQLSSMTQLVECVNITIEDTLVEGSEYFSVEIAPLNENDKIAGVGAITVTIDNDDGMYDISSLFICLCELKFIFYACRSYPANSSK